MKKIFLLLFGFLFCINTGFAALVIVQDEFITNPDNIISQSEETKMESFLQQLEEKTSAEIAVVIVKTLGDEEIFDFTIKLATEWGVGKADVDNGLMILIATEDKKWEIVTGYGLEGTIPDVLTRRIAEAHFSTHFKKGNYATGIQLALNDIAGLIEKDPTTVSKYTTSKNDNNDNDFLLIIYIIIFIIIIIIRSSITARHKNISLFTAIISNSLSVSSILSKGSSFGGFGGGSFGGGGSGGSW
ncbi:hypothetical protein COB57_03380 [Candidatus Peregrinibacteria bacterium]|nr:MAG: hypothetical protein COB57_03380 [Candidatus Peregrinibacteria bacterium]